MQRAEVDAACARLGAYPVVFGEPAYPPRLQDLPCPPPVLWVRGELWMGRVIAIVGTRRASGKACAWAEQAAGAMVAHCLDVVSGGAYGVDASSHRGAMGAGGTTTVVLGGGLDRPYPDRHIPLFEMAARHGAVLSPFPPGTPPARGGFLARNALIAALSDAVVVVEAGWRSGARSTALHARSIGRPVLAVPGSPGTDRLVSEGAMVASTPEALVAWVSGRAKGLGPGALEAKPLDPLLERLHLLGSATAAELAERAGCPVSEVLVVLTEHCLAGTVAEVPGGRYRLLVPAAGS